jgi:hypothetical protein
VALSDKLIKPFSCWCTFALVANATDCHLVTESERIERSLVTLLFALAMLADTHRSSAMQDIGMHNGIVTYNATIKTRAARLLPFFLRLTADNFEI